MRVAAHHAVLTTVVVGALLVYIYTTARYGHALAVADGHLYYTHAHSWYFDGDCDYANNLQSNPKLEVRGFYLAQRSPIGRVVDIFPCGWSVVAMPFVALADGLTVLHNALFGADIARDGYTGYYRAVVPLAHVLVGIAGLLAGYAVAARYFSPTIAAVATALVWMGTNVGYFVSVEPTMSHASSMGLVSLMIYTTDTIHRRGWSPARAVALGLCCGMMMAVRYQNFVWLAVPLVLLGIPLVEALIRRNGDSRQGLQESSSLRGGPRASARAELQAFDSLSQPGSDRTKTASAMIPALIAVVIAALCLVPQMIVNYSTYGTLTSNMADHAPAWLNPRFGRDLIAWPTGLFVLYPLTAICVGGAAALAWEHRRALPTYALAAGFAGSLYIGACAASGTSRKTVCLFVVFVLGLAAVLRWAARHNWRMAIGSALVGIVCLRNVAMVFLADQGLVNRYIFTATPDEAPNILVGLLRFVSMRWPA